MAQWHKQHATRSGESQETVEEEELGGGEGAKAYAPFGAGRETGHQKPAVAAKRRRKGDRYRGRVANKTLYRKERREKKEGKKRKEKKEREQSGKEERRGINGGRGESQ